MRRDFPDFRFASRLMLLALSALLSTSCEFRSRRAVWGLGPSVTYKLRYAVELKAKADGGWGAGAYASSAQAGFTVQSVPDTGKGQIEFSLSVDTLQYRSSERGPEEDQYMTGRLRKYKSKLLLSRTGQVLSKEEEPALPPVAFSPLNFGRALAYALPAFPDAPIRKGQRWEISQPLLDKFHPDSRVLKRFTLSAIRETPEGELATCLVEMDAYLDEDLGSGENAAKPSLSGSGRLVFNLTKGRPVSAELDLEGRFITHSNSQKSGDSSQPQAQPLRLEEKVSLSFAD